MKRTRNKFEEFHVSLIHDHQKHVFCTLGQRKVFTIHDSIFRYFDTVPCKFTVAVYKDVRYSKWRQNGGHVKVDGPVDGLIIGIPVPEK